MMKTSSRIVVLASPALALLMAALPQDSERAGRPGPAPTFQAQFSNDLGGDVLAETMVSVSDLLFDSNNNPVRVVLVTTTCHRGQVLLCRTHVLNTPFGVSADPVVSQPGPFEPGLCKALAAELLGETNPVALSGYVAGDKTVPAFNISVSPATGSAWGAVASESDLLVEVVPILESR